MEHCVTVTHTTISCTKGTNTSEHATNIVIHPCFNTKSPYALACAVQIDQSIKVDCLLLVHKLATVFKV